MPANAWRTFHVMSNTVLIVDDSHVVINVMRDFFESLTDWKIVGDAEDGAEAIQKAMELKPDLILLDFSMKDMNGIETASILKKMLPNVHIIVFTMYDTAVGSRLCSAVGVDLVVSKAEGLNGLVKAVNHIMGTTGLLKSAAKTDRQAVSPSEQT
jgi:DNA-binding NarL/FixJ family response regulator